MSRMENFLVSDVLDYASGTADRNSASVDMQGKEWVLFIAKFATVAAGAVTSVKLQQSADDSTFADLAGTGVTVAADDDNQSFAIALYRPSDRYVRLVVDKDAANATAETAFAISDPAGVGLASITDEITVEMHYSPAEGTA